MTLQEMQSRLVVVRNKIIVEQNDDKYRALVNEETALERAILLAQRKEGGAA